jgi:hypothetical protein
MHNLASSATGSQINRPAGSIVSYKIRTFVYICRDDLSRLRLLRRLMHSSISCLPLVVLRGCNTIMNIDFVS